MRSAILLVYVVMAVWLVVAAAGRLVLLVLGGRPLDPLPFITGALGLVALVVAVPVWVNRRRRAAARGLPEG